MNLVRLIDGAAIGLAVAVASLAVTLFGYRLCTSITQVDDALPRWAKEHGFRIISKESRTFFQGPFNSVFRALLAAYRPAYYVTLEDQRHRQRKAWVRLGWWCFVVFRESIEVRWEE